MHSRWNTWKVEARLSQEVNRSKISMQRVKLWQLQAAWNPTSLSSWRSSQTSRSSRLLRRTSHPCLACSPSSCSRSPSSASQRETCIISSHQSSQVKTKRMARPRHRRKKRGMSLKRLKLKFIELTSKWTRWSTVTRWNSTSNSQIITILAKYSARSLSIWTVPRYLTRFTKRWALAKNKATLIYMRSKPARKWWAPRAWWRVSNPSLHFRICQVAQASRFTRSDSKWWLKTSYSTSFRRLKSRPRTAVCFISRIAQAQALKINYMGNNCKALPKSCSFSVLAS